MSSGIPRVTFFCSLLIGEYFPTLAAFIKSFIVYPLNYIGHKYIVNAWYKSKRRIAGL